MNQNEIETDLIVLRSPRKELIRDSDILSNNYQLKFHQFVQYLGLLIDRGVSWNR